MEPHQSQSITSEAIQYGVLGIVALVFAYAIIHLFKTMRADVKAQNDERQKWTAEREAMKLEYERKHREIVERYAKDLREDRDESRRREDAARKDFAELMEEVAASAAKSSEALSVSLNKMYERIVPPRSGGRY